MLRLTSQTHSFFPSVFQSIIPQKIKKDVWDFGDKISIGNRNANEVLTWEAVDRNSFYYNDNIIFIDVLNSIDGNGCGPCEKNTYDCLLYDAEYMQLEVRDGMQTLLVSIKNPENPEEIYETLNYFLGDQKASADKYDWIGTEQLFKRSPFISKKANDKKKRDILAKTPRIALSTAVVNDKRKRT